MRSRIADDLVARRTRATNRSSTRSLMALGLAAVTAVGAALAFDRTRALGIAGPLAVLAGLALITQPASFVAFYVGLRPLVDAAVYVQLGGWTLGTVWGAGLILSIAVYWLVRGIRRPAPGADWLLPFGFAFAYVLAALARTGLSSADLSNAVSNCVKLGSFVLVGFTCEQIASSASGQRQIMRAGTVMAVLAVAVIALAIVRNQYGIAYYTTTVRDTVGQTPHGYASLAVLSSTFVWIAAMRDKPQWHWILLAGLLGAGVALSFVRTTFLAFALIAAWFLLWSVRRKRMSSVTAASAVVASVGGVLYAFRDIVAQRLADFSFLSSGGGMAGMAGSSRIGIWQAVLLSATSSSSAFLLGQGPAASFRATLAALGGEFWSHNDYLEFLITGGIGLLVLYILLIAWLLVSMTRLARDTRQSSAVHDVARLMSVVVVAFVVMGVFNGIVFEQSSLAMAVLVGLARGMYRTPGATFLD